MKCFKHLANLCERCKKAYVDRQCEKYCDLMLTGQLRIWDVPLKWRRNPDIAVHLYITAFRIARGTSLEQYAEDLIAFETELLLFKATKSYDPVLWERLNRLYHERQIELEDQRRREIYENAFRRAMQRELHSV